ncbi:MAG: hypothetical protein ACJAY5_000929 [Actinomycetes bacterium]|jgi:hypothetical protein
MSLLASNESETNSVWFLKPRNKPTERLTMYSWPDRLG